eukprot:427189-Rhodomonas_salina.2
MQTAVSNNNFLDKAKSIGIDETRMIGVDETRSIGVDEIRSTGLLSNNAQKGEGAAAAGTGDGGDGGSEERGNEGGGGGGGRGGSLFQNLLSQIQNEVQRSRKDGESRNGGVMQGSNTVDGVQRLEFSHDLRASQLETGVAEECPPWLQQFQNFGTPSDRASESQSIQHEQPRRTALANSDLLADASDPIAPPPSSELSSSFSFLDSHISNGSRAAPARANPAAEELNICSSFYMQTFAELQHEKHALPWYHAHVHGNAPVIKGCKTDIHGSDVAVYGWSAKLIRSWYRCYRVSSKWNLVTFLEISSRVTSDWGCLTNWWVHLSRATTNLMLHSKLFHTSTFRFAH